MDRLRQDLRFALRQVGRSPLLSLVAALFLGYVPLVRRGAGSVASVLRDGSRGSSSKSGAANSRTAAALSQSRKSEHFTRQRRAWAAT